MEVAFKVSQELGWTIAGTTLGEVVNRIGILLTDVGPEASLAGKA
jgi:hypothetical protein